MSKSLNVKVLGNKATIIKESGRPSPIQFIRIGKEWKFDFSVLEKMPHSKIQMESMKRAFPKIITEIESIEKKVEQNSITPQEIQKNLVDQFQTIMQKTALEVVKEAKTKGEF